MLWSRAGRVLDASRHRDLTYAEVGATGRSPLPQGYHHVTRRRVVGHGGEAFAAAAAAVMRWQMHRGAGLRVAATTDEAAVGTVVVLGVGFGPLRLLTPCRVVEVTDEPDRAGFAYGTLPGHQERGEERFEVVRRDDEVALEITAFSRHAAWYARLGSPVATRVQAVVTERYVRAVRSAVTAASFRTG